MIGFQRFLPSAPIGPPRRREDKTSYPLDENESVASSANERDVQEANEWESFYTREGESEHMT
jgi:hypothetical protein